MVDESDDPYVTVDLDFPILFFPAMGRLVRSRLPEALYHLLPAVLTRPASGTEDCHVRRDVGNERIDSIRGEILVENDFRHFAQLLLRRRQFQRWGFVLLLHTTQSRNREH